MRFLPLILVLSLIVLPGCKRDDIEILTRIGWKVADKVQVLVPDQTPFGGTWNSIVGGGLENQIRQRIRSDKYLANEKIELYLDGKIVTITGSVSEEAIRQRAIEMIEATVGVESVVDQIEVSAIEE